jgi:hypothetical protein
VSKPIDANQSQLGDLADDDRQRQAHDGAYAREQPTHPRGSLTQASSDVSALHAAVVGGDETCAAAQRTPSGLDLLSQIPSTNERSEGGLNARRGG